MTLEDPAPRTVASSLVQGVLTLEIDNPPVNALSEGVRIALWTALEDADADTKVRAIIIAGRRGFIAGADIREFGRPVKFPAIRELLARLDAMTKPVIAAIDGVALGGGFELALACHYRVATPNAVLGLPEVKLGLLPGAGGTQRLPRIVGARRALDMILNGRRLTGDEGLEEGLVDRVATDALHGARALADEVASVRPLPSTRRRKSGVELSEAGAFPEVRARMATAWAGQMAPWKVVDCVEASEQLDFEAGVAFERDAFLACAASPQHKAMVHVFNAERAMKKDPPDPAIVADRLRTAMTDEVAAITLEGRPLDSIAQALQGFGFPGSVRQQPGADHPTDPEPDGEDARSVGSRIALAMVRVTEKLRSEDIIRRDADIDVIAVRELGFPAHRGGPAYWTTNMNI